MKLKDQVCSLELAKRLKELGVPQGSLFYWTYCEAWFITYRHPENESNPLSAFTVSELGELYENIDNDALVAWDATQGSYTGRWFVPDVDEIAKMLIWLIEQGYIKYA